MSYISTDIMGINTANGNLTPRISKRLDKWFDYEEITFLRVFYTLIMIDNIPKDEVTFWHCMTVTMKEYGVFKDTKALKDYVSSTFRTKFNRGEHVSSVCIVMSVNIDYCCFFPGDKAFQSNSK